jgi:hypothetical protein
MRLDSDLFVKGEGVADFVSSMPADIQDTFNTLWLEAKDAVGDPDLLRRDLNVLVIAEPWSGDVLYNLPVLLALAETASWEVRIFRRDQYPELIEGYKKENLYRSIPVFVFLDQEFIELGHWIERPEEATRVIEEESLALRRRLRKENSVAWRDETISELRTLLSE